jgi:nucleoid-associated protein YgaU
MKQLVVMTALSLALASCGKDERRSPEPSPTIAPPTASTAPIPAAVVPPASAPGAGSAVETGAAASGAGVERPAVPARRTARGARSRAVAAAQAGATHTVARGDTLAGIAKSRGMSAVDLAKWNAVRDPRRLRVGQQLRLTPP